MTETGDRLLIDRKSRRPRMRLGAFAAVLLPFLAVLSSVYIRQFLEQLEYLKLPLLVVVYFALLWRSPIGGLSYGAAVGLLEDSLANHPTGMFGIVKTLVGYFAASMSLRFDVDNSAIRFVLVFFFFLFHEVFYWIMERALLRLDTPLKLAEMLIVAMLNACVAVPLYLLLDKMKERS